MPQTMQTTRIEDPRAGLDIDEGGGTSRLGPKDHLDSPNESAIWDGLQAEPGLAAPDPGMRNPNTMEKVQMGDLTSSLVATGDEKNMEMMRKGAEYMDAGSMVPSEEALKLLHYADAPVAAGAGVVSAGKNAMAAGDMGMREQYYEAGGMALNAAATMGNVAASVGMVAAEEATGAAYMTAGVAIMSKIGGGHAGMTNTDAYSKDLQSLKSRVSGAGSESVLKVIESLIATNDVHYYDAMANSASGAAEAAGVMMTASPTAGMYLGGGATKLAEAFSYMTRATAEYHGFCDTNEQLAAGAEKRSSDAKSAVRAAVEGHQDIQNLGELYRLCKYIDSGVASEMKAAVNQLEDEERKRLLLQVM